MKRKKIMSSNSKRWLGLCALGLLFILSGSMANATNLPSGNSDGIAMKVQNKTVTGELETRLFFTNSMTKSITGQVRWKVFDSLNQVVKSASRPVTLSATKGESHQEVFRAPLVKGVYKVVCYFSNELLKIKIKNETYYLTVEHMDLPVSTLPAPKVRYVIADAYQSPINGNQPVQGFVKDRLNQFLHVRFNKVSGEAILEEENSGSDKKDSMSISVGKYLSAASMVWKFTQDKQLKKQIDSLAFALSHTQHGDGFLGIRTSISFSEKDIESMKNNISGLLAYYSATGFTGALESAVKGGNLIYTTFNEETGNSKLFEIGGLQATAIMEPMISLYTLTGDPRYLKFCYHSINEIEKPGRPQLLKSLSKDGKFDFTDIRMEDVLQNLIAVLKIYRITGEQKYLEPCRSAWDGIVNDPSLLSVGGSKEERLDALNSWTQFNAQFALSTGEISYFNQIDKAIFQSKIPSIQPFYPLGQIDNHPVIISYETGNFKDQLLTYDGSQVELSVQQESRYPREGSVSLILNPSKETSFTLSLRRPARSIYYKAVIAGKTYTVSPNHFLNIQRFWKKGDQIDIQFEMLPDYVTGNQEDAAYQKEETEQDKNDKKNKVRRQIRRTW